MPGDITTIPVDWLRSRYAYEPDTGVIRYTTGHSKMLGAQAGSIRYDGYRVLKVSYQGRRIQVMAHILAWILHYGEHPAGEVDHKNLDRDANWIENLRLGNRSQNLANRAPVGDLPKGVTRSRSRAKPYQAQISVDGQSRYLGLFSCPLAAHAAYASAAIEAFGDFARLQ